MVLLKNSNSTFDMDNYYIATHKVSFNQRHIVTRTIRSKYNTVIHKYATQSSGSGIHACRDRHISRAAKMAYRRLQSKDHLAELMSQNEKPAEDLQTKAKDLRNSYKEVMMSNAQLDNEKQALFYQLEDLVDKYDEQAELKAKSDAEANVLNRHIDEERRKLRYLETEEQKLKELMCDIDNLVKENRLVLLEVDKTSAEPLLSSDVLSEELQSQNTLDQILRRLHSENNSLRNQIKSKSVELDFEKQRNSPPKTVSLNSNRQAKHEEERIEKAQNQIANDCRDQMSKSYSRIEELEKQLLRLESHMHRYRQIFEDSERNKLELKSDNRKISKQIEESRRKIDELKTENSHLERRIERVKLVRENARESNSRV